MLKTLKKLSLIFCAGMISTSSPVFAQAEENIFKGGKDYVFSKNSNETIEQQIARSTNKLVVPKASVASMGQVYRKCAKDSGFRRKVEARAQIYSSHFMVVTLIQSPKMPLAQFNSAVACSKRAIAPRVMPTPVAFKPRPTVSTPSRPAAVASPIVTAESKSRFSVKQSSLETAQKEYARCVSASGFKGRPQLAVQKFESALSTIALVRDSNMTATQYDKSVSCMAKKVDSL